MPAATRLGDMQSGHGGFPAVALAEGSHNVFIDRLPAGREGDLYETHSHDGETHADAIIAGSANVFINGRRAARVGDAVEHGAAVAQGSPRVFVGDGGTQEASPVSCREHIKFLREHGKLTQEDETILCLKDIAENEAARAGNEADCQGWLYLSEMICKWLAGEASTNKDAAKPFYVDMDWALTYQDARNALTELSDERKLFNAAALKELKDLALEALGGGQQATFDYLASASIPGERSFQFTVVQGGYSAGSVNGLQASLGAFTFHAVPSGYIVRTSNDSYRLTVTSVKAVIWDSFDFEGDQFLGFWSCKNKKLAGPLSGKELLNRDFRAFRERYGIGSDFHVISDPVQIFSGEHTIAWSE